MRERCTPTVVALATLVALAACGQAGAPTPRLTPRPTSSAPAVAPVAIGQGAQTIDATTIVGRVPPAWQVDTWIHAAALTLDDLRGRVVLVRWFTDGCPFCEATAPTLVALHDELADRGLAVVGLYHHKSDAPLVDAEVAALADRFGFEFPVAIDRDWRTLEDWWMTDHPESWTSVSFLIDRRGVVRFVHTGGSYPPGSADAAQMRTWVDGLLAEPAPAPR